MKELIEQIAKALVREADQIQPMPGKAIVMTTQKQATAETHPEETVLAVPGDPEQSVYRFITVAAKRARQLQSGARPKIRMPSRKMTHVAVEETRRGLIEFIDPETAPPPEEGESTDQ